MMSNLERYKKDIDSLTDRGEKLHLAIQNECYPAEFKKEIQSQFKDKANKILKKLPSFEESYQTWYSEAKSLIRQLLPDRFDDFVRLYEKPKSRKSITYENYRIEDYLQGLTITIGWDKQKVVGPEAAIPHFRQQLAIVRAVEARFESSLFDIRQLVQADMFDSELESALSLSRAKHYRAAGVLAGVVLERHLYQVADNHGIKIRKKNAGIADWNEALKAAGVIDIPQWRYLQHLADVRNICAHYKERDPKPDEVDDLVEGAKKTVKFLF